MITTRRWSPPILASFALETLLAAGCASVARNEPDPSAPVSPPSSSRPVAISTAESGEELGPRGVAANMRERANTMAQCLTTNRLEPLDWSTKVTPEQGIGADGASAAPRTLGAPPPAFAERRASEALDRLAGLVTVRYEKRGAVITLLSDKLVDSGQWALTTSGQYSLRELAPGLRDQEGRTIFIQGYTDSMGTSAANDALSLRRAEAVRDYFSTQGVAAESMRPEGFGAKRPVAGNGTAVGRAQNRRIEIVVAP